MKIAFMMLCHKNPDQVNFLIRHLSSENTTFFIHVDRKSNIYDRIQHDDNIYFAERIAVSWGDISQIKAEISLMRAVKDSGQSFDYVWLISGQDFPIQNIKRIEEFLTERNGKNFIEVISETHPRYRRYLKRVNIWYPKWGANPNFFIRVFRKLYMVLTGGMEHSFIKRFNDLNKKFYFGSQWFTITYPCMLDCLEELEKGNILKYYKNTLVPDESVFQTIIMNSQWRNTVCDNLLYTDWSVNRNHPKILTTEDVPKMACSGKLIARKFDEIPIEVRRMSELRDDQN